MAICFAGRGSRAVRYETLDLRRRLPVRGHARPRSLSGRATGGVSRVAVYCHKSLMYFDFEDYRPETPRVHERRLGARGRAAVDHRPPGAGDRPAAVSGPADARSSADARGHGRCPSPTASRMRFVEVVPLKDMPAPPDSAGRPVRPGPASCDARAGARSPRTPRRSCAAIRRRWSRAAADAAGWRPPPPPPAVGRGDAAAARRPGAAEPRRAGASHAACAASAGADLGRLAAEPAAVPARRISFDNPQGGDTDQSADIQFDSKGIDFGPWLRRFKNQVERNWLVPRPR